MQIAIVCIGTRGDVQPYIALGIGLQRAGHTVRLVTHPDFATLVLAYGLDFSPILGDSRQLVQSLTAVVATEDGTGQFFQRIFRVVRPRLHELFYQAFSECLGACASADAIITSFIGTYVAYHIAEKLACPLIPAFVQPVTPTGAFPSTMLPPIPEKFPWRPTYNRLGYSLGRLVSWQFLRTMTNAARRDILRLPPMSFGGPFVSIERQHRPILYGFSPLVIAHPFDWTPNHYITGTWFLDHLPTWQPPPSLVAFLAAGPPPISIGFGSLTTSNPDAWTELVCAALASCGQRGVILTGWNGFGQIKELPATIYQADDIPHDWLFPQMSAVIHNGSAGTTAAGLRAGKPSMLIPHVFDEPLWGERVFQLGVGPRPLVAKQLTTEHLADVIADTVKDHAMHIKAEALGKSIEAEDGVARAVEFFHQVIA